MTLNELVNKKYEVNKELTEVKLWLSQKESVEYYNYLQNGGNARTAKDKIIDELKMKDDEWFQREIRYNNLKVVYTYIGDCLSTVQKMIDNQEYHVREINIFLDGIVL